MEWLKLICLHVCNQVSKDMDLTDRVNPQKPGSLSRWGCLSDGLSPKSTFFLSSSARTCSSGSKPPNLLVAVFEYVVRVSKSSPNRAVNVALDWACRCILMRHITTTISSADHL